MINYATWMHGQCHGTSFFTSTPRGVRRILLSVCQSVCLSVCLSARITRNPYGRTPPTFMHAVTKLERGAHDWVPCYDQHFTSRSTTFARWRLRRGSNPL